MLNFLPHTRHGAEVFWYLDAVPHLLGVVLRRDVFHLLRQAGAECHDVGRARLCMDVVCNLPSEDIRASRLETPCNRRELSALFSKKIVINNYHSCEY